HRDRDARLHGAMLARLARDLDTGAEQEVAAEAASGDRGSRRTAGATATAPGAPRPMNVRTAARARPVRRSWARTLRRTPRRVGPGVRWASRRAPFSTVRAAATTPSNLRTLATDIGGTGLKALVLGADGKALTERARIDTPRPATPSALVPAIIKLVQ